MLAARPRADYDCHLIATGEVDRHAALALLSPDELKRAAGFRHERNGHEFVATRASLRRLLGADLGAGPSELRFAYGERGKPFLAGGGPEFSVAHSGGHALIALCRGGRIGVDLELLRDVPCLRLAGQFFAAEEAAALRSLPAADLRPAFFRLWARKEAYLKARGTGLPGGLEWAAFEPPDAERWLFAEPDAPPGFAAAIAVERG